MQLWRLLGVSIKVLSRKTEGNESYACFFPGSSLSSHIQIILFAQREIQIKHFFHQMKRRGERRLDVLMFDLLIYFKAKQVI